MSGNGDYISREVALDAISEWLMKALHPENMSSSYNEGERAAYRTAISEIAELPATNVRPVVLCRDCIFRSNEWTGCPKLNGTITGDDFFCKCGIKREES